MVAGGKREARGPRLASEARSPGRGERYGVLAPAEALLKSIFTGGCACSRLPSFAPPGPLMLKAVSGGLSGLCLMFDSIS
jgi:hypothetical protein